MQIAPSYRLGPFKVDVDGGLMPPIDRSAHFRVNWRGCAVSAGIRATRDESAEEIVSLELSAIIGRVPSSASGGPPQRENALALLRGMAGAVPAGLTVGLSADHRLVLQSARRLEVPVTARRLVAEVTDFVLEVAPYLDLAGESGAVVPAGMVNT